MQLGWGVVAIVFTIVFEMNSAFAQSAYELESLEGDMAPVESIEESIEETYEVAPPESTERPRRRRRHGERRRRPSAPSPSRPPREEDDICRHQRARVIEIPLSQKLVNGRLPADGGLADRQIALTFDDGPFNGRTLRVLDDLRHCGVRATFFMVANKVRELEERNRDLPLLVRMVREGHIIASHTWTHGYRMANLAERDFDGNLPLIRHEIIDGHAYIMSRVQMAVDHAAYRDGIRRQYVYTPFFRFPYGSGHKNETLQNWLGQIGLTSFFWNSGSGDSDPHRPRGPDAVYNFSVASVSRARHGIFLAHDRADATSRMIGRFIRWLMRNDYTFVVFTPDR